MTGLNAFHPENIKSLKIVDKLTNEIYWNNQELLDELKYGFIIPSSKMRVTLIYEKSKDVINDLPYVKLSYMGLKRVMVLEDNFNTRSIDVNNFNVKNNLNWLIIAPKGYSIIARIKSAHGQGQLTFASLSSFFYLFYFTSKIKSLNHFQG